MNVVHLMGRLVRDVEVRYSQSGNVVANFTLAIDRPSFKKDTPKETDFIRCIAFGKTGEVVGNYVSKGQRLLVEGSLRVGSYEDKTGNKRITTDVIINKVHFIERKNSTSYAPNGGFEKFGGDDNEAISF